MNMTRHETTLRECVIVYIPYLPAGRLRAVASLRGYVVGGWANRPAALSDDKKKINRRCFDYTTLRVLTTTTVVLYS